MGGIGINPNITNVQMKKTATLKKQLINYWMESKSHVTHHPISHWA